MGGPCQGIRNSIPELAALGCNNEIVCLDDPAADYLTDELLTIHALGQGTGPWGRHPDLKPWLAEHLPRFDIVIIHGLWQYHSYAVTTVMQRLRKRLAAGTSATLAKRKKTESHSCSRLPRVFVMPHGMLDPWFQKDPSRRLKAYRNWAYWKLIERQTIEMADGMLFTCQKELELARKPFRPYRPRRELNVGYGVAPPPTETPAMRNAFLATCPELINPLTATMNRMAAGPSECQTISQRWKGGSHVSAVVSGGAAPVNSGAIELKGTELEIKPYLLFLSRIHPKKGIDLLINGYVDVALAQHTVRASMPDLVIAGPTDSTYASSMQLLASRRAEEARQRGASCAIHFSGMLTGDAKWGAFYGCEAFVLPSHQENFGIAVVEALACRKAVLISDQVNICDEISAAGAGIVRPTTATGVSEVLSLWLGMSDESRRRITDQTTACYQTHYQPRQAASQMLSALEGRT
ncbi:N,N'-diacetylbacillosaminyl-diphospho-undecaprenol alpha-1,3-N-acetylgalactosaminyltransferase [Stieleria neptunia]|uniref:N, N'-diacetylbacillosaminyl-diphospho-undecaprenol alpha-1,3-N-acetylgalactosaminyltransferase n=2 Tax=Stieleria neptunia TaxID=2527979 RepID=A0A518HKE8_9BACT|nr:N,N'-diacetylbacillosaminyl-diphospho-undecaprenol alpha-1,3-N-acetylgalactosaminyltransferase [Stieleria neptunia]